jgi:hypothetical protein
MAARPCTRLAGVRLYSQCVEPMLIGMTDPGDLRLARLLLNAELHFDPVVPKERVRCLRDLLSWSLTPRAQSPEAEERLDLLRQQQLAQEYANMIQPMHRSSLPASFRVATEKPVDTRREDDFARRQLSAMINVIASMMAVATAAWWAGASLGGGGPRAQGLVRPPALAHHVRLTSR